MVASFPGCFLLQVTDSCGNEIRKMVLHHLFYLIAKRIKQVY